MISRNNVKERLVTNAEQVPRYGIRKLSVGVASVLLGTTLYLGSGAVVHADTVAADGPDAKPHAETPASVDTHEVDVSDSAAVSANSSVSDINSSSDAAGAGAVDSDHVLSADFSMVTGDHKDADAATSTGDVRSVGSVVTNSADSADQAGGSEATGQANSAVNAGLEPAVQASLADKRAQALNAKVNDLFSAENEVALADNKVTDGTNVGVYIAPNQDGNQNKELVGTGKSETVTLADGSSLTTQFNILDDKNSSAILTFKSSAFKAGDVYTIKIPKAGGLKLSEIDIAKLQPAFGTTTFDDRDPDWYVITDEFINSGTVSQNIKLGRYFDIYKTPDLCKLGSFTEIVNDIALLNGDDATTLTVTNISPKLIMRGAGIESAKISAKSWIYADEKINLADRTNPMISNGSKIEPKYELYVDNSNVADHRSPEARWSINPLKTLKIHLDKSVLDPGLVIESVKLFDPVDVKVLIERNFDSDGNVEFTSDDFNRLSVLETGDEIGFLRFLFPMHIVVSDDKFVHHKYSIPINNSAITISAEDYNHVLYEDHPQLGSAIVLNDLSNLTTGELLTYSQNYMAGYADNDYSIPLLHDSFLVNNGHKNANELRNLSGLAFSAFGSDATVSTNTNYSFSNFEYTVNIPDGLQFVNRGDVRVEDKRLLIDDKFPAGDYMIVRYRDGSSAVTTTRRIPQSDKAISSILFHLAKFEDDRIYLWPKSTNDQDLLLFSKTYADGTPVQVGDLFTITATVSADGFAPQTIDLTYIRAVDHNQNLPKGVNDGIIVNQSDKTPGVRNSGHVNYYSDSDSLVGMVYPQYEHPVVYLSVPKNASLSDLSKINIETIDDSGTRRKLISLTPKSITMIKIDNSSFIKVDLSNYNKLDNGVMITVPYDNLPDLQSSSEKTAFLVTADNLNDPEMKNVHHYVADAGSALRTVFGKLVAQEKIDVSYTDYYESSRSDQTWDILTSDGLGSATMTSGNKMYNPSLDSKHDDHGTNADQFNIYGTTIDATDVAVRGATQVINLPNIVDGTSQFNVQLTGPISLVNANTGADLSQLATIHYSTSRGDLSKVTVDNGQFTGGLFASQVTDWSEIQSVMIRFNSALPARTSARAVLPVKDPHIYDHVGKTIYVENVVYAYDDADHNANGFALKPIYIKPGSLASAKLTVEGQATVTTWVHYQDAKGQDQYIQLPDKTKTYNELADMMKRTDFMSSDDDLTAYDKSLLPSNLVIDWSRQPTIQNSSNTYLNGYQNGLAEFGELVKYDFDGDRVVYEAGFAKQVIQTKTVKRTIHYKYANGTTAKPDVVQTSKQFTDIGFENPFTHQISWMPIADNDILRRAFTFKITGYTADQRWVGSLTVTPDDEDTEVTVVYNPDPQTLSVAYIDDTTGQTLDTQSLTGVSDASADYNTNAAIDSYKAQGYDLVSDNTNGVNLVFDHDTSVDQHYEVHLKHHLENVSRTSKVNETINYVNAEDHSPVATAYQAPVITFVQNGVTDAVTKQTTWSPVAGQQFVAVPSPKVAGYTADLVEVPAITVNVGDADVVRTVTYTANLQNLTVVFIDDTTGQTLKTVAKSGPSDTSADYSTKNDLADYQAQHYFVVSDSTQGQTLVFDHDDHADQHYEVHLRHTTQPLNETHDVSRVIHYVYADGSKVADDSTQQIHFARDGYRDEVTNEDHWNGWTPGTTHKFAAVPSPKIQGFTPDIQTVDQTTVTPASQNNEQIVTYHANVQLGHVKYIDDSDNGRVMSSDDLSGHTGETDAYTTTKNIQHYLTQGYVLVSDNYPATGLVFDNNDLVDQYFEVHFQHGTVTITPKQPGQPGEPINPGDPNGAHYSNGTDAASLQADVQRTIDYVYQNGKPAHASINDSLHFTETKVIDKVTGKVLRAEWSPAQDFETMITPIIPGYTPDRQSVANPGITHDHPAIHEMVTYNPNTQTAVVKYIDDTAQQQLSAEDLTGHSDEDSGYNTQATIAKYLGQHYVLVSDATHGQNVVYDHDDKTDQVYEVHFKHGTEPANESRTKDLTVHYVYANGLARTGQAAADQTAPSLTFKRTGIKDLVTNNIAWQAWDHAEQTFAAISSPTIAGYTPDQGSIKGVQVNADGLTLTEVTVVYQANSQKLTVNFIDNVTGKTLQTVNKVGHSDERVGYNTKDDLNGYLAKYYDLVRDDTNGDDLVFDHDDQADQVYNVHLTHHTHAINDQVTKTEVIHYVYAAGLARTVQAAADYHAKALTFTRAGYRDEVTNEDHWNAWTPAQQTFAKVKSPTIAGYTADQVEIPAMEMTAASDNIERTVTYQADSQTLTVVFIDDTTGKTLTTVTKTGRSDESAGYNTNDDLKRYQDLHYNVVSDGTQGQDLVFDHDDGQDQRYEVHLVHATHSISQEVATKQTIHYQLADGTKVFNDHTSQVDFSRDGYHDEVTNEDHWNPWAPSATQALNEVVSPVKPGYTPDQARVAAVTVQPGDKDVETTVVYAPDPQVMTINYFDDVTGKLLATKHLTGVSDASANYNTKSTIDDYLAEHYELVSDDTKGAALVFDHDDHTDQVYNVHLTHTYQTVGEQRSVYETVHYRYENGQPARPDYQAPAIDFNRTGTKDLVTDQIAWQAWIPAEQSFAFVTTPAINGYTSDVEAVASVKVNPGSTDVERTVTYHADDQTILINYIDDETHAILKTDTVIGKTAQTSDYTTKQTLAGYRADHYELVSDDTKGQKLVFDSDSTKAQVYNVHLKHAHQAVNDSTAVNETIHYVYADGSKVRDDYHAPAISFTRTGDRDLVTNAITWQAWQPASQAFPAVDSPVMAGYTSSQATIGTITVKPGNKNIEQTVVYAPNTQSIVVNYVDDVTGKTLKTDTLMGKSDRTSDYTTKNMITGYENQHYVLIHDDTTGKPLTFDHDDQATQVYNVHFSHQTELARQSRTVHETIDYVYADGAKAADSVTAQPLTFTQTGVKDLVTGKIDWNGTWTAAQTFAAVKSPTITGYTASRTVVKPITVAHDSSDIHQTVTYVANNQTAKVNYIDDATGKILETDQASGKFGEPIKFEQDLDQQIKAFESQGYRFQSTSFTGQSYQADNAQNEFEVHFTHGTQNVSRTQQVTETVKYQFADGRSAQSDHTQTVAFTQHGVQDLVTQTTVWAPSDSQTFAAVATPLLTGYTADVVSVPAVTVNFGDDDITKVVTYHANDQLAGIKYVDDTTGKTLDSQAASGKFGTLIEFMTAPAAMIQTFEKQGYELVSNTFTGQAYQVDNAENQFAVHLKHGTKNVSRTATVTRTISYVDQTTGTEVHPPVVQTLTFTESGVTDLVTGETTWTTPGEQRFTEVESPKLPGYEILDVPVVEAKTAGFGDDDQTVTVHYQKVETPTTLDTPTPSTPQDTKTPTDSATPTASGAPTETNHSMVSRRTSAPATSQPVTDQRGENQLPQTGNQADQQAGLLGLAGVTLAGLLGLGKRRKQND